jgi:hypothetical protein
MQAYETGLRSNDTRMLLRPDSEFFRYFVDPSGKPREEGSRNTSGNTNSNTNTSTSANTNPNTK